MKTKFFFIGCLLLSSFVLKAQAVFPVVYHVLYNNTTNNLPDSVLQHQLDVLNEDYNAQNADLVNVPAVWQPIIGNMQIQFHLATTDPQGNPTSGIERRQVTSWPTTGNQACSFAAGGLDAWPDSAYLNIWVYQLNGPLAFTAFPSAPFNGCRGLYIDWHVVGRNDANQSAPYNLGRTATHELAHFFGLYHIWGDDAGSCSGTDYISDTPNQSDETYGNPGVGTVITDACTPSAPGIMWMNFLDFTDDAGMCMFTQGQAVWVSAVINSYYSSFRTVGVEENSVTVSAYSVFPSPSSTGIFQVNRSNIEEKTSFEVYDLQGRMILAPQYFESGSTVMQFDLSGYTNGTYTVIVRNEAATETKRVVLAQ